MTKKPYVPHPYEAVRVIDPRRMDTRAAHRLLLHCVAPRPIAFVSTRSASNAPNLAPFSYFMAGGANPPSVVISPLTNRVGEPKDTLRNILETGEYVINAVTRQMADAVNLASAEFACDVSEWDETGFTPAPSVIVGPARVAQSPMSLECRLFSVVPHGSGPLSANYVIGEVVQFHIAESLFDGDDLDPRRVDYIARMGANWYAQANAASMFEMPRPPSIDNATP